MPADKADYFEYATSDAPQPGYQGAQPTHAIEDKAPQEASLPDSPDQFEPPRPWEVVDVVSGPYAGNRGVYLQDVDEDRILLRGSDYSKDIAMVAVDRNDIRKKVGR